MLILLDRLYDKLAPSQGLLGDWHCIYVQHLLESNLDCINFLGRFGLRADRLTVFGKSYSTSQSALREARRRGLDVRTGYGAYNFERHFDAHIIDAVAEKLLELADAGVERVLLIDEGGIAARAYESLKNLRLPRPVVVELTARGIQYYDRLQGVPIVDVAGSQAKKNIENAVIARSMMDHLAQALFEFGLAEPYDCRIGLLGTGAIGTAIVAECKRRGIGLSYSDTNASRPQNCLPNDLKECDVLLASTGAGVDWQAFASHPRTIFVNCGSSDVEFNLWRTNVSGGGQSVSFLPDAPWRGALRVVKEQTECVFLRGGFPINFDGSGDPIEPNAISLTRALLMAGALQSVTLSGGGVRALDGALQRWISEEYAQIVGAANLPGLEDNGLL